MMRATPWDRTRRVLPIALAASAGGCGGGSRECVPCVEPVGFYDVELKAIEAEVEEVQVGQESGTTAGTDQAERYFQLTAWYLDVNDSIISGRFKPFKWTEHPTNSFTAEEFGRIKVRDFDPPQVTLRVASPDGLFQDEVAFRRWPAWSTAAATEDVVEAPHTPGRVPEVVLLEEQKGGTCAWGRARAFVGYAAVGQQDERPCSLALLSADHAMVFQDPAAGQWVPAAAAVANAPAGSVAAPTVGPPRILKVNVYIAVTGRTVSRLSQLDLSDNAQLAQDVVAAAEAQARADVTRTNMIFEANRVGIRLDASYPKLSLTSDLPTRVGAMGPFSCDAPRKLAPPEYDPGVLAVYYVDWIDVPAEPPTHPGASGFHCEYRADGGPVIYISYTRQSTFTLAHEIGHALWLRHGQDLPAGTLDALNLMQDLLDDGPLGADARSRLTVGQAVRMNIENESWVTQPPGAAPARNCWPTSPCPPDDLDAR